MTAMMTSRSGIFAVLLVVQNGSQGNLPGLLLGIAVDAGGDQGKGNGMAALFGGLLHGHAVAGGQLLGLSMVAACPSGANGVDDVFCFQMKPGGHHSAARGTAGIGIAGLLELLGSCGLENSPADPAALGQSRIGGIHNAVRIQLRDIDFFDFQRTGHKVHSFIHNLSLFYPCAGENSRTSFVFSPKKSLPKAGFQDKGPALFF